jgi:hypothetical protein
VKGEKVMVAKSNKGNVDKHNYNYGYVRGVKIQETQKWGRSNAAERVGALKQPDMKAKDQSAPQKLGDSDNLQGPGYRNETSGWVRGAGENPENKPGYVHGPAATKSYPYSAKSAGRGAILPPRLRDDPGPWLGKATPRKK